MLGLFPHMRYREWYAIGELVDNSLQSWISNRLQLREVDGADYCLQIHITVDANDGGEITIRDNAAGIAGRDWGRAFQVAEPPSDASGLSQFGVGMKASSCWFARQWALRTTALGEAVERSVEFDVPAILRDGTEELTVTETPATAESHWTELRLWNLHRVPHGRTIGKIKDHLASIYRTFLREGKVLITYNGAPLAYQEHPVLVAPYYLDPDGGDVVWRKEVELRLESGRRVTGWAAVRESGKQREVGLALLYRGKVVTGAGEDLYKPDAIFGSGNSFESQRLYGELDMSDFDVTYTKDNLVWFDEEDDVIAQLKDALEAEPKPVLKQAHGFRARKIEENPRDQIATFARRTSQLLRDAGDIGDLWEWAEDAPGSDPEDGLDAGRPPSGPAIVQHPHELVLDGATWTADVELIDEPSVTSWITVHRDAVSADPAVSVKVNQAHPFMRAFCEMPAQDLEPVWRIALAVGLAQEVARARGAKFPNYVTQAVNNLVRVLAVQPA
jgi:hypothetical protein